MGRGGLIAQDLDMRRCESRRAIHTEYCFSLPLYWLLAFIRGQKLGNLPGCVRTYDPMGQVFAANAVDKSIWQALLIPQSHALQFDPPCTGVRDGKISQQSRTFQLGESNFVTQHLLG